MYQVLYAGFDTLDIAYRAALPPEILAQLNEARDRAETSQKDEPVIIGPAQERLLIKPHGQRGGFRYVAINGPTGAIFSIKNDSDPSQWNVFVSVRALCLLTRGYEETKQWLMKTLIGMGFTITDHSVNRMDYAIDVLAPDFVLDAANFIYPGQTKARLHWSKETLLEDDGNTPQAVMKNRKFESVTIGKMPNRQVIVYDKRRASIDLKQPYWFDAWGIAKSDPVARIWRIELRAGRDALAKLSARHTNRHLDTIEHLLPNYFYKAAKEIRYVIEPEALSNVSRAELQPLWQTLTRQLATCPTSSEPALPEARVLEIIRQQRRDIALKQGMGNLLNAFALDGNTTEDITQNLATRTTDAAKSYATELGNKLLHKKVAETIGRLSMLLPR
ncbi:hypothetical protein [Thalassospira povalilytica]|uniref:hypothetical protein n=1 Tax=Thalassospira povalilytica TaxID=732237 RepID=UPI001D187CFE|nr:hypothetical protein [Thalassospira povalilytica]MCC4242756.1 hypothetical protein [Thalassospira povalilytica]